MDFLKTLGSSTLKSFEGEYNLAVGNNTWNNCSNKGNINLTFLKYIPWTAEFAKKKVDFICTLLQKGACTNNAHLS